MIVRMKLNARLFHLPPKKWPESKPGPKPPKGKRLLDMEKRLTDKRIKWTRVLFSPCGPGRSIADLRETRCGGR